MKLYSQSQRSFIVDKTQILKGGSYQPHDMMKERLYINPKDKFEVYDEYGKKLMAMYPDQFMQLDETGKVIAKPKNRIKKVAAKVKPRKEVAKASKKG